MRKLIFIFILLASFIGAQSAQAQRQTVNTEHDTVISDNTEYIEVSIGGLYQSAAFEIEAEELDDSIDVEITLQATVDDVWVDLDPDSYTSSNTETDGSESSGTATLTTDGQYWYIELFDPPAPNYRLKITGTADNDKVSGTAIKLNYYLK